MDDRRVLNGIFWFLRSVTPGQDHDVSAASALLIHLQDGQIVLGDKAYGADWIRRQIEDEGAAPNIPDRSNRRQLHCFSKTLCQHRNLIERFFNKIQYFRRLATRYDKLASSFPAMLKLAAIRLWFRHNGSTA